MMFTFPDLPGGRPVTLLSLTVAATLTACGDGSSASVGYVSLRALEQ